VRLLRDAKAALNIDDTQIGSKDDNDDKASVLNKANGAKQNLPHKRKGKASTAYRTSNSNATKTSDGGSRTTGGSNNGATTSSASLAIPSAPPEAASYELSYTGSFGSQGSYGSSPPSISPPRLLVGGDMVQGKKGSSPSTAANERTQLKLPGNGQSTTSKGYSALDQQEDEETGEAPLGTNPRSIIGRDAELGLLPPPLERSLFTSSTDTKVGGKHSRKRKKKSHVRLCILDFCGATGLDASAARSCFLMLKQTLKTHGILCIFVVSSQPITDLLLAHQVRYVL